VLTFEQNGYGALIERDELDLAANMTPDFLHEFELGLVKDLITHLVRILFTRVDGDATVDLLNRR
jgi:hypothetical protein